MRAEGQQMLLGRGSGGTASQWTRAASEAASSLLTVLQWLQPSRLGGALVLASQGPAGSGGPVPGGVGRECVAIICRCKSGEINVRGPRPAPPRPTLRSFVCGSERGGAGQLAVTLGAAAAPARDAAGVARSHLAASNLF